MEKYGLDYWVDYTTQGASYRYVTGYMAYKYAGEEYENWLWTPLDNYYGTVVLSNDAIDRKRFVTADGTEGTTDIVVGTDWRASNIKIGVFDNVACKGTPLDWSYGGAKISADTTTVKGGENCKKGVRVSLQADLLWRLTKIGEIDGWIQWELK